VYIIFITCLFLTKSSQCQQKEVLFQNKTYRVYTNLEDALKVNPDSVFGIELRSMGLKDFPVEILKFKNIEFIDLSCFYWYQVPEKLSTKQRIVLESALKRRGSELENVYNQNHIKKIPTEITKLKRLEVINITLCDIKLKTVKKLSDLIPKTIIIPSYETLKGINELQKKYN